MCLLPFVFQELGVLQLVPVWGALWTLDALGRAVERPSVRTAITCGFAFGLTYLMCNYYGLFLSVLIALISPLLLIRRGFDRRLPGHTLLAVAVAVAVVFPVVSHQLEAGRRWNLNRDPSLMSRLSAEHRDYLRFPDSRFPRLSLTPLAGPASKRSWNLGTGTLTLVAAVVGLIAGITTRGHRFRTVLLLLFGGGACLLSLGPGATLLGMPLFDWLIEWWPGLSKVRSPYRFSMFVQLVVVLLAGGGVHCLAGLSPGRWWSRRSDTSPGPDRGRSLVWRASIAVFAIAAIAEVWPHPLPLYTVPDRLLTRHGATGWSNTHHPMQRSSVSRWPAAAA